MEGGEPRQATVAYVGRLEPAYSRETQDGRTMRLSGFKVVRELPTANASPDRTRSTRIAFLASSTLVSIGGAVCIALLNSQLGVDRTLAFRTSACMVAGTFVMFFWSLHRILLGKPSGRTRRHSLDEIDFDDFRSRVLYRARVERAIVALLHLGWMLPLSGALVAILSPSGWLRLSGLATGAGLGAIALFLKSAAVPVHRQADQAIQRIERTHARRLGPRKNRSDGDTGPPSERE